jgi:hypothetical protein
MAAAHRKGRAGALAPPRVAPHAPGSRFDGDPAVQA